MTGVEPKLVEYIKNSVAQGRSREDIYKELLSQGWTVEVIQESFNLISAEKAEKLEKEDISKRAIRIIVVLGAALIGAGIFSFIAANWLGMTKPLKIIIILSSMIGVYSVGWYVREKYKLRKTGEALILLGSIIYGAGIFLVAQMFHIQANWPDGFILWMIGTIATAFAAQAYSLFYFAIPVGVIAIFGYPFGIFTNFGYNRFLLTSPLLLIAATMVTFLTGWVVRKKMPPELKEFY
jgi:uncharacterized membrane protein